MFSGGYSGDQFLTHLAVVLLPQIENAAGNDETSMIIVFKRFWGMSAFLCAKLPQRTMQRDNCIPCLSE